METRYFVDPQNPYVFNEHFFANEEHFQFNGSVYSYLHRFFNVLASLLGFIGGSLVAYLALSFSRMLLLCAITDIIYSLCDFMCQARFQTTKEVLIFSLRGPVSLFSYQTQCYFVDAQSSAQVLETLRLR
ncbi:hypothetical protein M3Y97_01103400 [Aphelenchoides bicaudatus]|nr:hypothetical protein M3Y97_01103400 [Aphelenchoides bicaudatus]